jgi:M6 family metalloprotease-like protein
MGASTRRFVSALAAIAASGVLALPSPGAAQPCASGTDVRNLNDSAVPQSLKNQILLTPGQIISKASTGNYPSGKLVVIRAALQDAAVNPSVTPSYLNQIFYGTVAGSKSIKGYYAANSYAQFNVTAGSTPAWLTLSKKITDYTNGIEQNAVFLQDVLKAANVNWAALDTNHDGTLSVPEAQIVILVPNALPTTGLASTRNVNAGSVATPTGTFNFNNRPIVIFSLKSVVDPQYNINPIRSLATVAHELGHAFFNLPDRYGSNTGTGQYDMMGSALSDKWLHLPMHDKIKIGWIAPKIIRQHGGQCLQFLASELQAVALVVVPIDQFLATPLEYWVVENRDPLGDGGGYDDDLPDHGLAVWYTSVGTAPFGQDDVRLVDFSKPDQAGTSYNNPQGNALFTLNPADPQRLLFTRAGQWNLLWFQNVSDVNDNFSGLYMFAEF